MRRILQRPRILWASRFIREEPCTFLYVVCNLTVTWLQFLYCFDARNYFILPLSPIAAVVSQRINQSCWCIQEPVDHGKAWLPIHITSLVNSYAMFVIKHPSINHSNHIISYTKRMSHITMVYIKMFTWTYAVTDTKQQPRMYLKLFVLRHN